MIPDQAAEVIRCLWQISTWVGWIYGLLLVWFAMWTWRYFDRRYP